MVPTAKARPVGKERREVQALLERGRVKGYLTYDEVNDALPRDLVTSDQIDDLIGWLGDEEIQVVDSANQVRRQPQEVKGAAAAAKAKKKR